MHLHELTGWTKRYGFSESRFGSPLRFCDL